MKLEEVQEQQGVTEWVVSDFAGSLPSRFPFTSVKPGDVVNVFSPDGTFNTVLILPDGTNMILKTPY